jgi:uncharacterized protein YjbI with pentapeptide repeats
MRLFKDSETASRVVRGAEVGAALLTVFSIVVSATVFWLERSDRKRAVIFGAWNVLAGMEKKRADGGRSEALRQLRENEESLAGIDLSGGILRNLDLSNSDLTLASLKDVEFTHCLLRRVNLTDAILESGHFRQQCDFRGATFYRTKLQNAVLADSRLDGAEFLGAEGNVATSFNGAAMSKTVISNSVFANVIFDNADLTDARILESRIEKARFQKATINRCRLTGTKAEGTQFQNATGRNCIFGWGTVLDEAHFDRAVLDSPIFETTSLRGAIFFGAKLRGAEFRNCDLTGANFTSSDLTYAIFSECLIEGAVFTNSQLRPATAFVRCQGTPVDLPGDK